jgi:GNAT superfamily N-acetyltransferase
VDASTKADEIRAGQVVPGFKSDRPMEWAMRPAELADVEAIAELRAMVMRLNLERLGRFDEHRVRQRLRDSFSPQHTSVILADGAFAGCVTLRPAEDGQWLEHFYLAPGIQGRGLGSAVLRTLLDRTDADGVVVRLNVLQGSAARRLYERHGFTVEFQDPIDIYMVRLPGAAPSEREEDSGRT